MSLKNFLRKNNNRISRAPILGKSTPAMGSSNPIDKQPGDTTPAGEAEPVLNQKHIEPPPENDNPLKLRVYIPLRGIRRKLRRLVNRLYPELTPEEKAEREEKQRRKELKSLLTKEAKQVKSTLINALTNLELCYRHPKAERSFFADPIQRVKFSDIVMQPDALYFKVDAKRLPRGINILMLVAEEVLTVLSLAVNHRVTAQYNENVGCWFVVERATGVMGIPAHVKLTDLWEKIPASADGLTVPIGMTSNTRMVYRSLGSMYSMLIGGTIGAGKSNILNVIICTLIRRNSPERLKLLLVDLKGGLEFSFYEGIPHLLNTPALEEKGIKGGIADKREQVPAMLEYLLHEGERRLEVVRAAGHKDIGRYNQYNRKQALPHVVFIVDEWADIKIDPQTGRKSEDMLTNIAQRFRAVGIHVILCTQVPKSEVLSTRIKGVLPAKMAFSCPTNQGSMAIIDNGHAHSLAPAGRCVFQWTDELHVQTPYINDQLINDTVAAAKAGNRDKEAVVARAHDVTELEVQEWALNNQNGWLSFNKLWDHFKARGITQAELSSWLKSWEGDEFVIGSSLYRVTPGISNKGRRLVAVNEDDDNGQPQGVPA